MKRWLITSIIVNIFLLLLVVVMGLKTSFFEDVATHYGIIQKKKRVNQKAEDCLRGWSNSLESLHDSVDVLFIGNSIIYGGEFDLAFYDKKICNLGFPSDDLEGMIDRASQVKALHPKKVFLMGGLNGLSNMDLKNFKLLYSNLVSIIQSECYDTELYLLSLLPVNQKLSGNKLVSNEKIRKANILIKDIANEQSIQYIDLYKLYVKDDVLNEKYSTDGVHLKKEAYTLWYESIHKYIDK